MLKVPDFDNITYNDIINKSISKIPTMTDKWTDFNNSDPGITILQTYAWLIDMLNYYMNASGDVHVEKYLKLLGVIPKKKQAAKAYLCLEKQKEYISLPKGTQFFADDICFETKQSVQYCSNKFINYFNEVDGNSIDLTMFAGVDDDYATIFGEEFKNEAAGYFGFASPIGKETTMYVDVKDIGRNEMTQDFTLADVKWQYSTKDGFKDLLLVKDETCGLLKSGRLQFELTEESALFSNQEIGINAYYIRCVLKTNTYDQLPKIGKVFLNPFEVEQKKTICKTITIPYEGEDDICIDTAINDGSYFVLSVLQANDTYQIIHNDLSVELSHCNFYQDEESLIYHVEIDHEFYGIEKGATLQLMIMNQDFMPYLEIGITNGCVNQHVLFDLKDVYDLSVALWYKNENGKLEYIPYHYVEQIENAEFDEYAFSYEEESREIIFGDGIHGVLPRKGMAIYITDVSVSLFDDGNVMPREIKTMNECYEISESTIYNPERAQGGRTTETITEMLERLNEVLMKQNRLVCAEDYQKCIKETPGLMIDMVNVIPGSVYGKLHNLICYSNEVVVVIKPKSEQLLAVLSPLYKEKIMKYIDPYRLLNTKVRAVSPSYVGILVHGKIRLEDQESSVKEEIYQVLEKELSYVYHKDAFGRALILGRIFNKIEAIPGVTMVEQLSYDRIGRSADKNERGDIILHQDALSYLKEIDIEFH